MQLIVQYLKLVLYISHEAKFGIKTTRDYEIQCNLSLKQKILLENK